MMKSPVNPMHRSGILVTGSSGFVGSHLVGHLAAQKIPVVALYRHEMPEPTPYVFPVCSDMISTRLLLNPLRSIRTVVHLAWQETAMGKEKHNAKSYQEGSSENLTALKNLLAAMEDLGTQRFIFLSASGASRDATEAYLREKYEAEFMVLNSSVPEKIILRPTAIYGRHGLGDDFVRSILRVLRRPLVYPVPRQQKSLAPIFVGDLVQTIHSLCMSPVPQKSALIDMVGDKSYRLDDLFKMIKNHFVEGSRFPLRGFLGDTLFALYDRRRKEDQNIPPLKKYLMVATDASGPQSEGNDQELYAPFMPERPMNFEDYLETNHKNAS